MVKNRVQICVILNRFSHESTFQLDSVICGEETPALEVELCKWIQRPVKQKTCICEYFMSIYIDFGTRRRFRRTSDVGIWCVWCYESISVAW